MTAPGDPPEESAPVPFYQAFSLRWSRLLFGAVALATFLGLFAAWSTFAEITTHFRAVYAWAAFFAMLLALPARSWRLCALCAALLVWQLVDIVPWYAAPSFDPVPSGPRIRLLTANIYEGNRDFDRLLDLIAREDPDLIFVQELSPGWIRAFSALRDRYPYSVGTDRLDSFGMAVYSRFPIQNVRDDDPVDRRMPIIRGDIEVGGRVVHIINAHLSPPEGSTLTEIRLRQFPWLTEYIESLDGPVILAGDLNCTMWSPLYKRLVRRGGLASARKGRGVMPTWLRLGGPLYLLPLDHVLVRDAAIVAARLGDSIASDHRPIVAEMVITGE